ncbi:MAG TPA: glycosyltransferase N-terminal domain-containing protein, partial [Leptospiraceae bacterium]|nr:glycosyltransferase N-terminal domain-containing protein [Leptospiraceae bacterium]
MLLFYTVLTSLLFPFTLILPLLNKKAKSFLNKRHLDKKKIQDFFLEPNQRVIWLHASSVGELDQCKALAKVIRENEKDTFLLQSVFSDSVLEKNYDTENTNLTFRLPLDFYFSYDFVFKKFSPERLVLMAWDTWPHLVLAANRHNCKVYLACAVLDPKSKRSSFFAKGLTRAVFSRLYAISPVDESMVESFQELSDTKVRIKAFGDSRFDSVYHKIQSKKPNEEFVKFAQKQSQPIFILASTYKDCDSILLPNIENLLSFNFTIWIFPHHINSSRIEEILTSLKKRNLGVSLYSEAKNSCKDRIILFDVLGILAFAYFYGKIAYIGGAMHNKVHNVLEPAFFGLPLITGEKILNSFDAISLKEKGTLKTVNSSKEFLEAV